MSSQDTKRFYWLKLDKGFFKKAEIKVIEGMPNGKDYILFYLKLLCESTSHEGYLRLSQEIPYDENMLSTITNTNVDVVRSAIKVFSSLNMLQILDDGSYYMSRIQQMIGSETGNAIRKREYREKNKQKEIGTSSPNCPQDIEKDIEIELDKEIDIDKELDLDIEKDINNNSYISNTNDDDMPF